MIWRTDKPIGSPIVVYRDGNASPEILFMATKPYSHYYDEGGEEITDGMIQKWASLEDSSLPSNLDEAAEEWCKTNNKGIALSADKKSHYLAEGCEAFKAGAKWMARQGWIDDGSLPAETKQESDTLQGHREWTESEPVLVWDSMYGPRVDVTKNGKWMSEQRGGYTGQICHGIIAWKPIPEYGEKQ